MGIVSPGGDSHRLDDTQPFSFRSSRSPFTRIGCRERWACQLHLQRRFSNSAFVVLSVDYFKAAFLNRCIGQMSNQSE